MGLSVTPCDLHGRIFTRSMAAVPLKTSAYRVLKATSRGRHALTLIVRNSAGDREEADAEQSLGGQSLAATIKRKHQQVAAKLQELGVESLDERLQNASETPLNPPFRLGRLIEETIPFGRPVLIFEVFRITPGTTSVEVAEKARHYVKCGADAIAVQTDAEATSEGLRDLWSVCQAVPVPVLAKDWVLHPYQVVEAKEAGACGVIGCVASVLQKGAPIVSSYGAAVGMDIPVEVVNLSEVREMGDMGVPMFGMNLSVALSLAIPGARDDITKGLIGALPFGCTSLVGVRSVEDARRARLAGADALFITRSCIEGHVEGVEKLVEELKYVTSGDD